MQEGLLLRVWVSKSSPSQEPLVSSTLPDVVDATRTAASADAGTPAGTVVLRAAGLRVRGGTGTAAGGAGPGAGGAGGVCPPGGAAAAGGGGGAGGGVGGGGGGGGGGL